MHVNQLVRVRTSYNGGWGKGFVISAKFAGKNGKPLFELTRVVDGAVMPSLFSEGELRMVEPATPSAGPARIAGRRARTTGSGEGWPSGSGSALLTGPVSNGWSGLSLG